MSFNSHVYQQFAPLIKGMALLVLLLLSVWQLQQWLQQSTTMPIKYVRIEGELGRVSKAAISTSVSELVDTGYFAVDNEAILEKLTELEWVADASIMRVWPDMIVLSFKEQKPVAIWNKDALLNDIGDVFQPTITADLLALPHLSGRDGERKSILAQQQKINASIRSLGLSIQQLTLASHGSWTMVLSNGLAVKAGKRQPDKALVKSLNVLSSLQGELLDHIKHIDLRYPNGVSVVWNDGYQWVKVSDKPGAFTVKKGGLNKG